MAANTKKVAVFAIVIGDSDEPVFLQDLTPTPPALGEMATDDYLYHFLLHSSLDMVVEKQWTNPNLFLGVVETFREYSVSAWVSVSGAKLLLLHHGHGETNIKGFLKEAHALWVKQAVNPLQAREASIDNAALKLRVQGVAAKYLS
jgi:hypothetical protein